MTQTSFERQVRKAVLKSRFAASPIRSGSAGERTWVQVRWSWIDDERASLVDFLKSHGFDAKDRVEHVIVWSPK
jgi:hypothetical protein